MYIGVYLFSLPLLHILCTSVAYTLVYRLLPRLAPTNAHRSLLRQAFAFWTFFGAPVDMTDLHTTLLSTLYHPVIVVRPDHRIRYLNPILEDRRVLHIGSVRASCVVVDVRGAYYTRLNRFRATMRVLGRLEGIPVTWSVPLNYLASSFCPLIAILSVSLPDLRREIAQRCSKVYTRMTWRKRLRIFNREKHSLLS